MHVSADELVSQRHVLDFFFPAFDPKHVLLDFAIAPAGADESTAAPDSGAGDSGGGAASGASGGEAGRSPLEQSAALAAAAKVAAEKSARAAADVEIDEEVICC